MRHPESVIEMTRQIGIRGQQRGRSRAGDILAIANQVSLVVVSAFHRGLHPIPRALAENAKYVIESLDAAKQFGRQAHRVVEPAFQLADAQTQVARQPCQFGSALGEKTIRWTASATSGSPGRVQASSVASTAASGPGEFRDRSRSRARAGDKSSIGVHRPLSSRMGGVNRRAAPCG